jgi:hypothetical protein
MSCFGTFTNVKDKEITEISENLNKDNEIIEISEKINEDNEINQICEKLNIIKNDKDIPYFSFNGKSFYARHCH